MKKFTLKQYIEELKKYDQLIKIDDKINNEEFLNIEIPFVSYNSKEVEKNTLFVCKEM